MKKLFYLGAALLGMITFYSCDDDDDIGEKPSLEGAMTLQGLDGTETGTTPGTNAANSVYVDFSTDTQTPVARKSWNLGFYCGSSFAVILNGTTSSTAVQKSINVADVVSSADSASYATELTLNYTDKMSYLDDMAGDLTKTVIKANNVYVVNPGDGQSPLYKVQVTQKDANTYTLKYAKINESTVTTLDISKNSDYNFKFVSFASGSEISVEPAKTKWDIRWSKTIYFTTMGTSLIPYTMSDFVTINYLSGVEVAVVDPATVTYDNFTSTNLTGLTFSNSITAIGSGWRNTTGSSIGIINQFYIVKDAAGNHYKLQFLTMGVGSDGGVRGNPELKYALVQ